MLSLATLLAVFLTPVLLLLGFFAGYRRALGPAPERAGAEERPRSTEAGERDARGRLGLPPGPQGALSGVEGAGRLGPPGGPPGRTDSEHGKADPRAPRG